MSITVTCSCGKKLSARKEHIGKRAKCPQCGQLFLVAPPKQDTLPQAIVSSPASEPMYDGHRVEHWLELLRSSSPADRRKAAEVLVGVGPEAASELTILIGHAVSEHVLVRHWATVCLGQIGPAAKEAMGPLLDRLSDEQPLVREKAAWAIEQILPEARPFVARLVRGLNDHEAERRNANIELFRRDLKTIGVSRFRFWACACGRVYIKLDLEGRLRQLVDSPGEVDWQGTRSCAKCGAQYSDRDVFAGKYDVLEEHWAKLRNKFGPQLSVPDDFLADPVEESGYRISEDARGGDALPGMPALAPFSLSLESPALMENDQGYAIAEAPPAALHSAAPAAPPEAVELVPGAVVPRSGKYKCISCGKKRLSSAADAKLPAKTNVIMPFKSGKTFAECPHCGDLTEWEWLG
jgi:DNA-directed RNA polymerase subunit RPC12/RpoP